MKTNILIVNWKSPHSIKNCIDSIVVSNDCNFRIVIINNFSTNWDFDEIKYIHKLYDSKIEIYLVENNENKGYAGGNNSGYYFLERNNLSGNILILNADVLISKNTISEMNRVLLNDVGIVTVRTKNNEGKILYDAVKLKGFINKYIISNQEIVATDYSQGACMLINRDAIKKNGFFDERFFLYWEEVDFSLRLKETGLKLISITNTHVIRESNSDSRQPLAFYYSIRNARLIMKKHKNIFNIQSYLFYLIYMFLLTFKFIKNKSLFLETIFNYFSALKDSYNSKYYRRNSF